MSRNIIQQHEAYQENPMNRTEKGKVIITSCNGRELALLIENNRLLSLYTLDNPSKVGAIYIGKVKNVVKNLNACFVEIPEEEICFLPFHEAEHPLLLNRFYDGRLLQGDELLVQVQRDAIKTKQAALTCNITLPNDCFVFTVGNPKVGISNKLSNQLRADILTFLSETHLTDEKGIFRQNDGLPTYGCVIRTEAGKLFTENKEQFYQTLLEAESQFLQLLENAKYKTCFSCLKAPQKPFEAVLSSFGPTEYEEVLTDLPEAYTSLQGHTPNLRFYDDATFPLYKLYSLETRLQEAVSKTVWLKSGANLVIEQTECLTTIDVNSGKMIKETQNAAATWKINEEAAREAALQIRLRNLSGIIIIDFINMKEKDLEEKLLKRMREFVARDSVPTTVVDITPLGLMELTRKKVNRSLREQLKK